MRALRLLPAALALAAAPAAAESELGFTHPAEICIEERADAVLGALLVDYIIAGPRGAANRPNPGDTFEAVAQECVSQHGLPQTSGRIAGKLVAAKSSRDEALRRLGARGPWVIAAFDKVRPDMGEDIVRIRDAILAQMREAPPVGLSIDAADGSEEGRVTGILVLVYVSGVVQLAQARAEATP